MKNLAVAIILALTAISVFVISCKHEIPLVDTPAPPPANGGTGGPGGTGSLVVCFESDILPIFQTNCAKAGCHNAASHEEGYVLTSYATIISKGINKGNASNSKIYKVLFETGNDRMPQSPNPALTTEQKALIGRWINEGANNTVNCNTGACDTSQFKFTADIKPILSTNCTGCHGGNAPSAGINLTIYDQVRTVAMNGRMIRAITHAAGAIPMPQGAAKLSDCKIIQINKWIASGSPNN